MLILANLNVKTMLGLITVRFFCKARTPAHPESVLMEVLPWAGI